MELSLVPACTEVMGKKTQHIWRVNTKRHTSVNEDELTGLIFKLLKGG